MLVTCDVSKLDISKFVKFEQRKNIELILFTCVVLKLDKSKDVI